MRQPSLPWLQRTVAKQVMSSRGFFVETRFRADGSTLGVRRAILCLHLVMLGHQLGCLLLGLLLECKTRPGIELVHLLQADTSIG